MVEDCPGFYQDFITTLIIGVLKFNHYISTFSEACVSEIQ